MITRHKVAAMAIIVSTSITIGAVVGHTDSPMAVHAQPTTPHVTQHHTTRTIDMPNLVAPFVSEDRYVNGEWIGHVTPSGLPHASGTCIACP